MTVTGSGNVTGSGTGGAVVAQNLTGSLSGDLTINTSGNFNNYIVARVLSAANNANIFVTHTGTLSANADAITAVTAGDFSRNATFAFDGLLTTAFVSANNAYFNSLATGTAGTGTPLTSSNRGSIVEIESISSPQSSMR